MNSAPLLNKTSAVELNWPKAQSAHATLEVDSVLLAKRTVPSNILDSQSCSIEIFETSMYIIYSILKF